MMDYLRFLRSSGLWFPVALSLVGLVLAVCALVLTS